MQDTINPTTADPDVDHLPSEIVAAIIEGQLELVDAEVAVLTNALNALNAPDVPPLGPAPTTGIAADIVRVLDDLDRSLTASEVAQLLGANPGTISTTLVKLRRDGIIRRAERGYTR